MQLTKDEKEYIKKLVKKELKDFKEERTALRDVGLKFLKSEEEYEDFMENIIKKMG